MPFVYLLRCGDGTFYAGAAMDLARRLSAHRAGKASRYTRSRLPVDMVWWREAPTWSAALRDEVRLKRLRRAAKEELVRAAKEELVRAGSPTPAPAPAPDPAPAPAAAPDDVSAP